MFGSTPNGTNGANAYAKIGIETGISSASPHRLVTMLYEGAIIAISTALQQMKTGNTSAKGQSISKAISIIDSGLRASLNKDVGGGIAASLDGLYQYMSHRLLVANLNNQQDALEEVLKLLQDLKSAWDAIALSKPHEQPGADAPSALSALPATEQKTPAYGALAPKTSRLVKA